MPVVMQNIDYIDEKWEKFVETLYNRSRRHDVNLLLFWPTEAWYMTDVCVLCEYAMLRKLIGKDCWASIARPCFLQPSGPRKPQTQQ